MEQKAGTIEVVIYETKDEFSQEETQKALLSLNDCIQHYPGFLGRKLCRDAHGKWMDLVYWTNQDAALKAAEDVMKNPAALKVFNRINEETMQMFHFNVIEDFVNKPLNQVL